MSLAKAKKNGEMSAKNNVRIYDCDAQNIFVSITVKNL